jgi:hypothetical protein
MFALAASFFTPLLYKWETIIQYQYKKVHLFVLISGVFEDFSLGEILNHTEKAA